MATLDQSYAGTINNSFPIGYSSGTKMAQSFTPSVTGNVHSVVLNFSKVGSPAGNLVVGVYDDNSGEPGSLLTSEETYTASSISTTYPTADPITFTFSSQAELTASTLYWIVTSASEVWDGTDHIKILSHFPSEYASGTEAYWNGATWANSNSDELFEEYYELGGPAASRRFVITN